MNKKGNLKYQKTHSEILETVLDFLNTKELRKITVAEICRNVGINRSTFYEHFLDVYDVLEKTEQDYEVCMVEIIRGKLRISRKQMFIEILQFIKENRNFYARYCALGNVIQISDEILLGDVLDYKKGVIDKRFGENNRDAEYHLAFFRGGINAILKKWIENNCNESEEYIFNLLVNEYGIR
ncbi:TetR/AcrR family transcriptional regulator [Oscillospiraceae bacterium LCP25S3_E3]